MIQLSNEIHRLIATLTVGELKNAKVNALIVGTSLFSSRWLMEMSVHAQMIFTHLLRYLKLCSFHTNIYRQCNFNIFRDSLTLL
jgi:hypothetical protein